MIPINSAQNWWTVYARNLSAFRWIANSIWASDEFSSVKFTPLENLKTFDIQTARDQLQAIWIAAPDHPVIHKWPSWGRLCDLCSDYDPEWADQLDPYVEQVEVSWLQQRAIDGMLKGLSVANVELGENDLIAGGWPRDLLRGSEAADIDVFVTRLCVSLRSTSIFDNPHPQVAENGDSANTPVVTRFRRLETEPLPTQVIEIPGSPVGYIRTFDAFCNMLAVDRYGVVWAYHRVAVAQAKEGTFQCNPLCNSGIDGLTRRALKFRAKGFFTIAAA